MKDGRVRLGPCNGFSLLPSTQVGKRRGGAKLALKTGVVAKKQKLDSEVSQTRNTHTHIHTILMEMSVNESAAAANRSPDAALIFRCKRKLLKVSQGGVFL